MRLWVGTGLARQRRVGRVGFCRCWGCSCCHGWGEGEADKEGWVAVCCWMSCISLSYGWDGHRQGLVGLGSVVLLPFLSFFFLLGEGQARAGWVGICSSSPFLFISVFHCTRSRQGLVGLGSALLVFLPFLMFFLPFLSLSLESCESGRGRSSCLLQLDFARRGEQKM